MEINKKTFRNIFLGVAGCILLYWLLHETDRLGGYLQAAKAVFSPFIVGAALAFILNVPMRAIERGMRFVKNGKLRRGLAILATILCVLLVIAGVMYLIVPQVITTVESLVAQLPAFLTRVQTWVNDFLEDNPQLMQWVMENTDFATLDWASLIQKAVTVVGDSLAAIMDKTISAIGSLSTGIFNAVMGIVFGLYCLARKEILARQCRRVLYSFLPEKISDEIIRIFRLTNATFSNFISGQCLEAVILGCMFAVSMLIFGMPYVPLVSVTIAVTALVPIVGAFAGCIVGAFFILVESPVLAFWFVIMFLVLQQIEGNLIYPRVVGTSVGLPGMWVLLAVAVGGDLMGVGGMLAMIPLASVLYTLAREITTKRLADREIPQEKLEAQPPELRSRFKEKREKHKKKRNLLKQLRRNNKAAQAKESDEEE